MKLSSCLVLAGSIFIAVVSLIAAFKAEETIMKVLLVLSTLVTLAIAIWRLYNNKRMNEEIKKLKEDKQNKLVFASKETCESIINELV